MDSCSHRHHPHLKLEALLYWKPVAPSAPHGPGRVIQPQIHPTPPACRVRHLGAQQGSLEHTTFLSIRMFTGSSERRKHLDPNCATHVSDCRLYMVLVVANKVRIVYRAADALLNAAVLSAVPRRDCTSWDLFCTSPFP